MTEMKKQTGRQEGAGDPVRNRLRARMQERGLTDREVSLQLGKSHSYMNQYFERGTPRKLPEDVRYRLASLLEMPEAALRDHFDMTYLQTAGGTNKAGIAETSGAGAGGRIANLIAHIRMTLRAEYFGNDGPLDLEEVTRLGDALIEHFSEGALAGALPTRMDLLRQAETLLKYKGIGGER
ncbi:MAG: hypothetical protein GC131_02835 [Alphaproteobacteria bacterium]|nr:hypothetical protein [Alphaproteobacteria bacterium]